MHVAFSRHITQTAPLVTCKLLVIFLIGVDDFVVLIAVIVRAPHPNSARLCAPTSVGRRSQVSGVSLLRALIHKVLYLASNRETLENTESAKERARSAKERAARPPVANKIIEFAKTRRPDLFDTTPTSNRDDDHEDLDIEYTETKKVRLQVSSRVLIVTFDGH